MKSGNFLFFSGLFGSKGGSIKPEASSPTAAKEVFATAAAQSHVLQGKMKEKQLTHGETVMASLSPVRLESAYGKMALYFCPMQTLDISDTITPGDGGEIPGEVVIEGLTIPSDYEPGVYSLKNVKLTSNGAIQVKTTAETTWEAV